MSAGANQNAIATVTNFPVETDDAWAEIETPPGYLLSARGVFQEPNDPKGSPVRLAGPVWATGQTRDGERHNWGLLLVWLDADGVRHEQAIARGRLHESTGTLVQDLAAQGLVVVPGKERALMTYLGAFEPAHRVRSADQLGWLAGQDTGLAYVLPTQVIGQIGEEPVHFQPERHSPSADTIRARGTLETWQLGVAMAAAENPYLIFALATAFAAPLLKPARLEAGGFHLYGRSSHGKTTAAQVAASVWGCGADPAEESAIAYIRRWNATANAMEGLAAAHNDGLLVLDELGSCGAQDFGRVVYDLMGGQGKAAMNSERGLRKARTWRSLVLSAGEVSTDQKIREDGRQLPRAGQRVRFMDIPTGESVITAPPPGRSPGAFSEELKRACTGHYGTAGPAFLEALTGAYASEEALSQAVQTRLHAARDQLAVRGLPAEAVRALSRLALVKVAGEWAVEFGLVPLDRSAIQRAVETVRDAWLTDGGHMTEGDRGIGAVREFILRHESRFADARDSHGPPVRDLAGYLDRTEQLYLFTQEGFREACQGMDPGAVSAALKRRDLLVTNEPRRHRCKRVVPALGAKRVRFYAVRQAIVEAEDHPE